MSSVGSSGSQPSINSIVETSGVPADQKVAQLTDQISSLHDAIGGLHESISRVETSLAGHESRLGELEGILRDIQKSEERRVGKECRSRWSPDH